MPKVFSGGVENADPRLEMDSGPDPQWWEGPEAEHRAAFGKPARSGYGHSAPLESILAECKIPEGAEELFDMALGGLLPRSRELKPWEPDKLNPRHLQIILLRASGVSNKRIADYFGVGESNVSIVTNHPDAQYIISRLFLFAAKTVTDIKTKITAAAPAITDELIGDFFNAEEKGMKSEVKHKLGFGLLAMAGYGQVQKTEAEVKHTFEMPAKQANLLTQAINEAKDIGGMADYVIVPEVGLPGSAIDAETDFGSDGGPLLTAGSDTSAPPAPRGSQVFDAEQRVA